ncbi:MAG: phospho-N-acetylmuramoyl-pentapeptide-transferase [Spirulinaceae cyanobacterium RM2_2_10]|nr:phospho-N-acetylmuramoyl-pentapeptide-transferase [Spirulinaceae cyanobacterium SM2_1_0]NJO21388.1 phospho-N-acetylmuramoyl-pentapeptide-transferase [Spirulinaceae cyanobacterium RM2_2_10]
MEAKIFSPVQLHKPTGRSLLALLALLLGGLALVGDWQAGVEASGLPSLTAPLLVCALVASGLGYGVVPLLRQLKAGQVIREDGPQAHLKKAGTPTMGGIFFVPVAAIIALLWTGFDSLAVAAVAITLFYASIGWLDDWRILHRKSNKGISPRLKLALQIGGAAAFCLWAVVSQPAAITTIALPLGFTLPLSYGFWLLAIFVFTAESNATNLTDGVDGLAGGTGAIAALGLAALIAPTAPSLAIFAACLSGACLGFVVHNRNPASVFMGDTGSLALGGALAAVGILSQNLWGLFLVSGLFFVEAISVLAQVSYYKATKGPDGIGKRLFKMAPIHHHLELSGWSETQIVGAFYLLVFGLVLLARLLPA